MPVYFKSKGWGDSVSKLPPSSFTLLERKMGQSYRLHLRAVFGLHAPLLRTSILFRPQQRYTALTTPHKMWLQQFRTTQRSYSMYPWWRRRVLPPRPKRLFFTSQRP